MHALFPAFFPPHPRTRSRHSFLPLNNLTPEKAFLAKNPDENARRAFRDLHGIFRTLTDTSARPATGLVGP